MKDINDLRTALFEAMADVRSGKLDVSKAKAVTDLAQTLVNTAKVEVDFVRATGSTRESEFITQKKEGLPDGVIGITRHRLEG